MPSLLVPSFPLARAPSALAIRFLIPIKKVSRSSSAQEHSTKLKQVQLRNLRSGGPLLGSCQHVSACIIGMLIWRFLATDAAVWAPLLQKWSAGAGAVSLNVALLLICPPTSNTCAWRLADGGFLMCGGDVSTKTVFANVTERDSLFYYRIEQKGPEVFSARCLVLLPNRTSLFAPKFQKSAERIRKRKERGEVFLLWLTLCDFQLFYCENFKALIMHLGKIVCNNT